MMPRANDTIPPCTKNNAVDLPIPRRCLAETTALFLPLYAGPARAEYSYFPVLTIKNGVFFLNITDNVYLCIGYLVGNDLRHFGLCRLN